MRVLLLHAQRILTQSADVAAGRKVAVTIHREERGEMTQHYPARVVVYVRRLLGQPVLFGESRTFTFTSQGAAETAAYDYGQSADAIQALLAYNTASIKRIRRELARATARQIQLLRAQCSQQHATTNDGEGPQA